MTNKFGYKIASLLLVLTLVISMAGCGGGDKAADTINVGAIFNLTGGQASLDEPSYYGLKLAAEEINAKEIGRASCRERV